MARYDKIGIGYDFGRKADPFLTERMYQLIEPRNNGLYLDVGCGTGNYTSALCKKGLRFIGVDPSEEMLQKAREKDDSVQWINGKAESLPLDSMSISGALVSLSIHHWEDLVKGFKEINRVLKKGRRFVLFTSLPKQKEHYWLQYYFPKMMKDSINVLPSKKSIEKAFSLAGFELVHVEPYYVRPDLQDGFLYSGKYDPSRYLNAEFRKGISSFSLIGNYEEIKSGLGRLKKDIESCAIQNIIEKYESNFGDYIFFVGKKS